MWKLTKKDLIRLLQEGHLITGINQVCRGYEYQLYFNKDNKIACKVNIGQSDIPFNQELIEDEEIEWHLDEEKERII